MGHGTKDRSLWRSSHLTPLRTWSPSPRREPCMDLDTLIVIHIAVVVLGCLATTVIAFVWSRGDEAPTSMSTGCTQDGAERLRTRELAAERATGTGRRIASSTLMVGAMRSRWAWTLWSPCQDCSRTLWRRRVTTAIPRFCFGLDSVLFHETGKSDRARPP